MFKNINWKKIGSWVLNAILVLLGGAGAGAGVSYATEGSPEAYESPIQVVWDSDFNYKVTASFAKQSPVKAGNFSDAKVEQDGLGVQTVYSPTLNEEDIVSAYEELTDYKRVRMVKRLRVEKRPGSQEPIQDPDTE